MQEDEWSIDHEQRARDRGVEADFGGWVLLGAFLNAGLDLLLARGLQLPRRIVVDHQPFADQHVESDRLFGGFDPETESIYINPRSAFFGFAPESAIRIAQVHFEEELWSTDSPHHVLLHELGHERFYYSDPHRYRSLRGEPLPDESLAEVWELVSRRATRGVAEFVAEVSAVLALGEYAHEDVLKWFRTFGGPMP